MSSARATNVAQRADWWKCGIGSAFGDDAWTFEESRVSHVGGHDVVRATAVLVISPTCELRRSLAALLNGSCDVTDARPGADVLRVLQRERPGVVIVDRIDERPEAAQLEIALVKELCPQARVIALSRNSSDADAFVVEQGIFCYVAAPGEGELVRLIQAATRAGDADFARNS